MRSPPQGPRRPQEQLQGQQLLRRPGEREWTPLILDKQGRQVDKSGNVLSTKRDVATFKVNTEKKSPQASAPKKVPFTGKIEDMKKTQYYGEQHYVTFLSSVCFFCFDLHRFFR